MHTCNPKFKVMTGLVRMQACMREEMGSGLLEVGYKAGYMDKVLGTSRYMFIGRSTFPAVTKPVIRLARE